MCTHVVLFGLFYPATRISLYFTYLVCTSSLLTLIYLSLHGSSVPVDQSNYLGLHTVQPLSELKSRRKSVFLITVEC